MAPNRTVERDARKSSARPSLWTLGRMKVSAEKITIDLGFASSKQSLHEMFAAVLGFPGYYGMNWDAFWDCVRDTEQSSLPRHLVLKGISNFEERLPDEARK